MYVLIVDGRIVRVSEESNGDDIWMELPDDFDYDHIYRYQVVDGELVDLGLSEAENASGGTLPAVTADDNGKVLQVIEGKWQPGEMPEGSLPVPGTAKAGQYLRVLEVDESGKITAMEAVSSTDHVIALTQDEYDALVAAGTVNENTWYLIKEDPA